MLLLHRDLHFIEISTLTLPYTIKKKPNNWFDVLQINLMFPDKCFVSDMRLIICAAFSYHFIQHKTNVLSTVPKASYVVLWRQKQQWHLQRNLREFHSITAWFFIKCCYTVKEKMVKQWRQNIKQTIILCTDNSRNQCTVHELLPKQNHSQRKRFPVI
jgi:hypothetical protein